jgi:carbamoyl-phosphate synthase large subunit
VIATDVSAYAPAVHLADRAYRVPLSTDPAYLQELLSLCAGDGVRLVVPTIDDELPLIGAAREAFAAVGAFAACSSEATALTCNDKALTCARLLEAGVPAARTWLPHALPAKPAFPVFIKPRSGRGAVGAHVVRNQRELAFFRDYVESPIVQEYLDGPEYTIDVLCDTAGRPLTIVPRERVVIRSGVIDRGRTVKSPVLIGLAERVCAAMPFVGPLNIQCRMRGDTPAVFEINPRFSGGIPLTIAAGADIPTMLIQLARGVAVAPQVGAFQDDLWISKYESAVFLPSSDLQLARPARVPVSIGEVA